MKSHPFEETLKHPINFVIILLHSNKQYWIPCPLDNTHPMHRIIQFMFGKNHTKSNCELKCNIMHQHDIHGSRIFRKPRVIIFILVWIARIHAYCIIINVFRPPVDVNMSDSPPISTVLWVGSNGSLDVKMLHHGAHQL